jgi:cell division protein FtsB
MKFVQIINQKKFALITIFLFLYVLFNLLDGERGLISYYEKQKIKEQLIEEKKALSIKLAKVEKKNMLLTDKVDIDYLEMLYREKFMVGKSNEHIYKSN